MMNTVFKRAASLACRRNLTASTQTLLHHLHSTAAATERNVETVLSGRFKPLSALLGSSARGFHGKSGPLNFRASWSLQAAEYAVEDYDEEKGGDGLEISNLGIAPEIVSALKNRGITKLFPIHMD